jgi:hypothetical protein
MVNVTKQVLIMFQRLFFDQIKQKIDQTIFSEFNAHDKFCEFLEKKEFYRYFGEFCAVNFIVDFFVRNIFPEEKNTEITKNVEFFLDRVGSVYIPQFCTQFLQAQILGQRQKKVLRSALIQRDALKMLDKNKKHREFINNLPLIKQAIRGIADELPLVNVEYFEPLFSFFV